MSFLIGGENNSGSGTQQEIISGIVCAVCYMVVDCGTHLTEYKGETLKRRKVRLGFEIPSFRIEIEKDGKKVDMPRVLSEVWTASTGRKSNLRSVLQRWDGKELEGDYPEYDLKTLLGRQCQLQVVERKKKNGGMCSKIIDILPPTAGMELECENPHVYFSFDDDKPIPEIITTGSLKWMMDRSLFPITEAFEYKNMNDDLPY